MACGQAEGAFRDTGVLFEAWGLVSFFKTWMMLEDFREVMASVG